VAVKKDKISDYTSAISQAGKNPAIVDVDVFALQNCYEVNYGVDPTRSTGGAHGTSGGTGATDVNVGFAGAGSIRRRSG